MTEKSEGESTTSLDSRGVGRWKVTNARVIVFKIGTNVLLHEDGRIALGRLHLLAESMAALRGEGRDVVLVASGAVSLGAERLSVWEGPLLSKEICAAIGQPRLMRLYGDAFEQLGVPSAQILLREDDLGNAERCDDVGGTLRNLLDHRVLPIVNQNDSVRLGSSSVDCGPGVSDGAPCSDRPGSPNGQRGTRALGVMDNDMLSARIAVTIKADLLVLLSDVEGLYTANPFESHDARLIRIVEGVTPQLHGAAAGARRRGTGGMTTKLEAALYAMVAGTCVVIASGRRPHVVEVICRGEEVGTLFLPGERDER